MLLSILAWRTISVLSILITESLSRSIIMIVAIFIIYIVVWLIRHISYRSLCWQGLYAVLCVLWSRTSIYHYQQDYLLTQRDTNITTTSRGRLVYQWPITIIQQWLNGRYQWLLDDGSERFVRSSNIYQAWDRVFITANIRYGMTGETLQLGLTPLNIWWNVLWWSWYEFNYPYRLMMKGIQWDMYESNSIVLHDQHHYSRLTVTKNTLQYLIATTLWTGQTAALTKGMLIGDKSWFTKPEYQMFIDSWLVHLIAVSWGNIIMLVTFLLVLLRWVPYYMRISLILVMVILYAIICGLDSSVVRAAIMWWLSLLALLVGRGIDIWRTIQLAWLGMIIINPYYLVYDVGFLLSFCAVIWLIVLTPQMTISIIDNSQNNKMQTRWWRMIYYVKYGLTQWRNRYLVPSCAATLWVLPIILFFMWSINLWGIIANLLVVPLVPLVMVLWCIVAVMYPLIEITPLIRLQHLMVNYIFEIGYITMRYGLYLDIHTGRVKICMLCAGLLRLMREAIRYQTTVTTSQTQSQDWSLGQSILY